MLRIAAFLFNSPTHPVVAKLDHPLYALRKEGLERF